MLMDLNILIGGPQGSGLDTTGHILTTALAHHGYGVAADREYYSNITGKHSYIHMRVSPNRIPYDLTYPVEILASIDAETIYHHYMDIKEGGYILVDKASLNIDIDKIVSIENYTRERYRDNLLKDVGSTLIKDILKYLGEEKGVSSIILDFREELRLLIDEFKVPTTQASRFISSIPLGFITGLVGIRYDAIRYGLERRFPGREEVIKYNMYLIENIGDKIRGEYGSPLKLGEPSLRFRECLVVTGNDAVAIGKIIGGLRFQSYYPITPAADECFFIEKHQDLNGRGPIIVLQTEDELAAIATAIGAALTGVRASTSTSGPGFSLMVEGLSWAGNNEVPVVITYYQRGAPATGLPTRGGQADLLFSIFSGHGEFTRVVISSGDHLEALMDAVLAFNIAERFQVPVIHLLDKYLANMFATIPLPDLEEVRIDRGLYAEDGGEYRRFDLSSIISPRMNIGGNAVIWYTGNEHTEEGHNTEDPILRERMYRKRMLKRELILDQLEEDQLYKYYGGDEPDYILYGWGSTKHTCIKAIEEINRRYGYNGAYLHLRLLEPFPSKKVYRILSRVDSDKLIGVEHSFDLQVGKLLSMHTGIMPGKKIVKYTGRPIYLNELIDALEKTIIKGVEKVVLTYGA